MKPRPCFILVALASLATLLLHGEQAPAPSAEERLRSSQAALAALRAKTQARQDTAEKWAAGIDPTKVKIVFHYLNDAARSQNPEAVAPGFFHGYKVVGSQALGTTEDKKFILAGLIRAIRAYDGNAAGCFSPNFGIKIETEGGKVVELVICFKCVTAEAHGLDNLSFFGVKGPAVDDFLALVKKLHLDPAEKK
jgi:hypothetical protein